MIRKIIFLFFFFIIQNFIPSLVFAEIPDEIDYQKYFKLFEDQKKVSDAARHKANQAYSVYEEKAAHRMWLEQERARILSEISDLRNAIASCQNRIQQLDYEQSNLQNSVIPRLQSDINYIDSSINSLHNQYSSLSSQYNSETDPAKKQQILAQMNSVQQQINNQQYQKSQKQNELNNAYARINQINSEKNQCYSNISRYQSQISSLQNQLPSQASINAAIAEENHAYNVYVDADKKAKIEETKTASQKKKYDDVLAKFEAEKTKAVVLASQNGAFGGQKEGIERGDVDGTKNGTSLGQTDGKNKGEAEGRKRDYDLGFKEGTLKGDEDGKKMGLFDGTETGSIDGKANGYKDGLDEGYRKGHEKGYAENYPKGYEAGNGPENFQKGVEAGLIKGANDADNTAMAEDFPKGQKDSEAEIKAQAPQHTTTIDNSDRNRVDNESRPLDLAVFSPVRLLSRGSEPSSIPPADFRYRQYLTYAHPEINAIYIATYDKKYVSSYESNYLKTYKLAYEKFYQKHYQIEYDKALALFYPDSKKTGYNDGYAKTYASSYIEAKKSAYDLAYKKNYDLSFEEGLPVKFDKGYQDGLEDGFQKGKKDGEEVAYQNGFKKGETDGFQKNIDGARKKAYQAGKKAMVDEYENNYKVACFGAELKELSDDTLYGLGENVWLNVHVRNYGGKPVPKGQLKVVLKDLNKTLDLIDDSANLKPLPAKTLATFTHTVEGNVTKKDSGEDIKIRAAVILNNKEICSYTIEQVIWPFLENNN